MDIDELRKLRGAALSEYARRLGENDKELCAAVAMLIDGGDMSDYETIAALISHVTVGVGDNNDFYARSESLDKRYLDIFIAAAEKAGRPEREYISVPIAARYAKPNGALSKWRDAADAYLRRRAERDYEFVADCIDVYDPKCGAYDVLFAVDPEKTERRLLYRLLYVKHNDKTAIREFFMDKPAVIDGLFALYGKSNAHERVKIVRLLGVLKNYERVKKFLAETAVADSSKTVRAVVARLDMRSRKPNDISAVDFFENAMITGETFSLAEFEALVCDGEYAAIADRLFFRVAAADIAVSEPDSAARSGIVVLMYDRGDFIDLNDRKIELSDDATIGVIHPAEVPAEANFIFTLSIEQPFEQVWRAVYRPQAGEIAYSDRLNGTVVARAAFDANFKRAGFVFCADTNGENAIAAIAVRGFAVAVECDTSHITSVACRRMTFYRASSIVKNRKLYIPKSGETAVCDVDPIAFSELMRAVCKLFEAE